MKLRLAAISSAPVERLKVWGFFMFSKHAVAAVVLVSFGGVFGFRWWQVRSTTPADSFTATQVEAIYEGEDPIVALTRTTTVAVRGDGSYAALGHFTDPSGGVKTWVTRGITDLTAREFVSIDPFSESVSTYPMSPQQAAHESRMVQSTCSGESAGTVLGFDVLLKEATVNEPGQRVDRIVTTSWLAPKLHCFPLRSESVFYAKGLVTQRTIKTVLSVRVGEPPGWVFERPSNYVERAPSEARREAERRYPNHECCKHASAGTDDDEEVYKDRRSQK